MDDKNIPNPKALNAYLDQLDEQLPAETIDFVPKLGEVKKEDKVAKGPNKTNG